MAEGALHDTTDGLLKVLGIQLVSADADRVELALALTADHLQPAGRTHGGVHCTLVETAASVGGYLWVQTQQGGTVVGVSNTTDFLRASSAGTTLTAVATPIHRGRTQQLWLVEIVTSEEGGAEGKLVARGQVRLQNLATT